MKNRRLLDIAEYVSLVGAGAGTVASIVSQQAAYASAPLSACLLLNLLNRRRLAQATEDMVPALNQLNQRLAMDARALQTLRRHMLTVPTPEDLNQVRETVQKGQQEMTGRVDEAIATIKASTQEQLRTLEAEQLNPTLEELAQLQARYTELQTYLEQVSQWMAGVAPAERVAQLEATLAEVQDNAQQVAAELQRLASQPAPNLTPLQNQLKQLSHQVSQLPPPYDPRKLESEMAILRQEVERLIQAVVTATPKQEWLALSAELEQLRHRHQNLGQTVAPLRGMMTELQGQIDSLRQQFAARPEPLKLEKLREGSSKLAKQVVALHQYLNGLPTSPVFAKLRTEFQAMVVRQTDQLQQQLQAVQQLMGDLESTVTQWGDRTEQFSGLAEQVNVVQQTLSSLEQAQTHLEQEQKQIQTQVENLATAQSTGLQATAVPSLSPTAGLEEATRDYLRKILTPKPHRAPEPAPTDATQDLDASLAQLMAQRPDNRTVLEEALQRTRERLIIAGPWPSHCMIDQDLIQKFQVLLNRNVRIDIDWNPVRQEDASTVSRRIHQRWDQSGSDTTGIYEVLKVLDQLRRSYPTRFGLKALGVQEKFLVCDSPQGDSSASRAFAVLGRYHVFATKPALASPAATLEPVSSAVSNGATESGAEKTPTTEETAHQTGDTFEVELCTTDPQIIQGLIDCFDRPVLPPQDAVAYSNRAVNRYDLGDYAGAIEDYIQVLRLKGRPDVAYNNRGLAFYDLGDKQKAIADFDRSLEFNPNNAVAYFNRGVARADLNDKQGAIADYTEALSLNPQDDLAYANRGLVRSKLGDKQGAITDYTEALTLNPHDDVSYFNRGAVRSSLSDLAGAIADYTEAIRINPDFANAYNNRGYAYQKTGNRAAAVQDFDRALEINPNFANAYNNRGTVRSKLGDYEGAIADFTKALQINPNFANAYNNRGTARSKLKDFAQAIQDFDRALEINPSFANVYNNRGLARAELQDHKGAIADLQHAAQLFASLGDRVNYQHTLKLLQKIEATQTPRTPAHPAAEIPNALPASPTLPELPTPDQGVQEPPPTEMAEATAPTLEDLFSSLPD